jgi:nitroreductase
MVNLKIFGYAQFVAPVKDCDAILIPKRNSSVPNLYQKPLTIKINLLLEKMNIFESIISWRPAKKFESKHIDDKLLGVMLHMATHAASAGNMQAWQFIVVRDDKIKEKLYTAALEQKQILEAPVDIIVCADLEKANLRYSTRGEVFYSIQDTAAAVQIILLAANALGLGSDWIKAFDEDKVRTAVDLPHNLRPVAIIPVGYASEEYDERKLLPFENFTWENKHGKKYELSYLIQPGNKRETSWKPIGNYIEEAFQKRRKEKPETQKMSFTQLLKKLKK